MSALDKFFVVKIFGNKIFSSFFQFFLTITMSKDYQIFSKCRLYTWCQSENLIELVVPHLTLFLILIMMPLGRYVATENDLTALSKIQNKSNCYVDRRKTLTLFSLIQAANFSCPQMAQHTFYIYILKCKIVHMKL